MRRFCCLILAGLLLLVWAGCRGQNDVSSPSSEGVPVAPDNTAVQSFSLAYNEADTLNPFTATTKANIELTALLYDSLTVLDGGFTPQLSLATEVTQTDLTHWTAVWNERAVFSDGTAVTGNDIVFSFQQAKASPHYTELLSSVSSASADQKNHTVTFTFSVPNPNGNACLSFPIIKADSHTSQPNTASVGSGRYVFTQGEDGVLLTANPYYPQKPSFSQVYLHNLPNTNTMYYGFTAGSITYYYDSLDSGAITRVSGSSATVNKNDLVFLGVNGAKEPFNNPLIRQAISSLIDRKNLTSSAFSGWGIPATLPFHPAWSMVEGIDGIAAGKDLPHGLELFSSVSLDPGNMKWELIYSSDNGSRGAVAESVRSFLEGAGIKVTVTPLSYGDYISRLSSGRYDLYIGEICLTADMNLSPLLGGTAGAGVSLQDTAVTAYASYRNGETALDGFCSAFSESLPYIPLCWRCGFAAFDRRLTDVTPHGYNPYYGFETWQ